MDFDWSLICKGNVITFFLDEQWMKCVTFDDDDLKVKNVPFDWGLFGYSWLIWSVMITHSVEVLLDLEFCRKFWPEIFVVDSNRDWSRDWHIVELVFVWERLASLDVSRLITREQFYSITVRFIACCSFELRLIEFAVRVGDRIVIMGDIFPTNEREKKHCTKSMHQLNAPDLIEIKSKNQAFEHGHELFLNESMNKLGRNSSSDCLVFIVSK